MRTLPVHPFVTLLIALVVSACAIPAARPAAEVTVTDAKDAQVTASWRGDVLILDVQSATGIGAAHVSLPADNLPRDLILRLHLSGLENLTFAYDAGTVQVAVPSQGEPIVRESFTPAGESSAQPIERGSAYWMDVGILGNDPKATPTIPLANGHFDVSAPTDFLERDVTDFSLSWVDFYR